jgi:ActR/RegA family two-component response regulator
VDRPAPPVGDHPARRLRMHRRTLQRILAKYAPRN